jgi:hypothetical protein
MSMNKKSPRTGIAGVGALREAVRRKSVGLSFTTSFGLFNRTPSGSTGEDDDSQTAAHRAANGSTASKSSNTAANIDEEGAEEDPDDSDSAKRYRSDSYPTDDQSSPSTNGTNGNRTSYVEPPEPPSLPPGGLLEAATKNVQGKMKDLMETYHEVSTSHDDASNQCSVFLSRSALFSDRLVVFLGDSDGSPAGVWSARLCVRSGHGGTW